LKTLSLDANVTLKIAQYQADPMIARIILEGEADAIISSDSDYSVYLGKYCLCVKDYDYKVQDGSIDNFIFSMGDQLMADQVDRCLSNLFHNVNYKFDQPKFSFFSREGDPLF